ncbi:recombinase family protein [Mycobacterium sp. SM1]|uniref:recombinase family protein n=1 Tax=Mycobacterium sp. SM1 TaxID=2816243 RepID=UPI0035A98F30
MVVPDRQHALVGKAAVYARVSTHKQREDLARQAQRMTAFANAAGLSVVAVIKEVACGVNDTWPKVTAGASPPSSITAARKMAAEVRGTRMGCGRAGDTTTTLAFPRPPRC